MSADENVSAFSHPIEVTSHIKKAFGDVSQMKLGDGLGELSKLGGEFISGTVGAVGAYLVADVLKNPNLKSSQKILPSIGYGLTLAAAVPLTVALIAGASALVPPFMFAASAVGVVKNMGTFLEERAERNNLRKELMSTDQLMSKIDKAGLTDENKAKVKSSISEQRKIYKYLYQLRKDVIASDKISPDEKQQLVQNLNKSIENFAKGELKSVDLNMQDLLKELQESLGKKTAKINQRLKTYDANCAAVKDMNLPKSLIKSIDAYKATREKVYAQDLSPAVKEKMAGMLEGKKLSTQALNDLYLRVGQQYLDSTTTDQLKTQDQLLEKRMGKFTQDPSEIKTAIDFCQKPRAIHDALKDMKLQIEQHPFSADNQNDKKQMLEVLDKFTERFKNNPDMATHWRETFQKEFAGKGYPIQAAAEGVSKQLTEFEKMSSDYKQSSIFKEQATLKALEKPTTAQSQQLAKINKLVNVVSSHQHQSLNQHANTLGQQFPVPKIDFDFKKNDLVAKAGSKLTDAASHLADKTRISSAFNAVASVAKSGPLKALFSDKKPAKDKVGTSNEGPGLKSEFKERYGATFNVMEKNQRLQFLKKSVPRRLANVGMSAGMCLLSLASTFVIPAVASPAAPVAIGATAAVGVASAALVVASTANSLDLTRKKMAGELKLSGAKSNIVKAVEPKADKDTQKPKAHKDTQKTVDVGATTAPLVKSRQDIHQAVQATPVLAGLSVEPIFGNTSKKANEPTQSVEAATLDRFKAVLAELSAVPSVVVDKADIHKTATATGPSNGTVARQSYTSQKGGMPTSLTAFDNAMSAASGENLRQIAQGGAPSQAASSRDAENTGPKTGRLK